MAKDITELRELIPVGTFCKFTVERDYAKYFNGTFIGLVRSNDPKNDYVDFGHPMRVEDNYMTAGMIHVENEHLVSVEGTDIETLKIWLDKYVEFHRSVVEEKGGDSCVEKLDPLVVYEGDHTYQPIILRDPREKKEDSTKDEDNEA